MRHLQQKAENICRQKDEGSQLNETVCADKGNFEKPKKNEYSMPHIT